MDFYYTRKTIAGNKDAFSVTYVAPKRLSDIGITHHLLSANYIATSPLYPTTTASY